MTNEKPEELKPCPVCKGNNLFCDFELICNDTIEDWYITCRDCDIQIHAGSEESVAEDWDALPRQELSELERKVVERIRAYAPRFEIDSIGSGGMDEERIIEIRLKPKTPEWMCPQCDHDSLDEHPRASVTCTLCGFNSSVDFLNHYHTLAAQRANVEG
jgi:hypothetical protein